MDTTFADKPDETQAKRVADDLLIGAPANRRPQPCDRCFPRRREGVGLLHSQGGVVLGRMHVDRVEARRDQGRCRALPEWDRGGEGNAARVRSSRQLKGEAMSKADVDEDVTVSDRASTKRSS
jgi:hypothetical protein